jgi:hypothetical protein
MCVGEFLKYLQVTTVLGRLCEAETTGTLAGLQLVSLPLQRTRAHGAVHAEASV